jgi:hypothetical protein
MYSKIRKCRICGSTQFAPVLDLGKQALTGVFPPQRDHRLTRGPLRLVKCIAPAGCGLVQLEHSYDLDELYGDNYGYRSGLNRHMVAHLGKRVRKIVDMVDLRPGDIVVDIGSNDATTLKSYPEMGLTLLGIDPTGSKFRDHYPETISLIPDFFSSKLFREHFPEKNAKIITSFAMFYDLESPIGFMQDIHEILADNGVWVFEQSYLGAMINTTSYDTICHEHLEYYSLRQIKWMADRVGFNIIDVEFNDINGGSFAVTVCKKSAAYPETQGVIERVLAEEARKGMDGLDYYENFKRQARKSRESIRNFVKDQKRQGKSICGLGASTKGNVILQYCGFTADSIDFIGEVNPDKFGCYTPGTRIPIKSEDELFDHAPDYVIVLPWHFRDFFTKSPKFKEFRLVFPLPELEIVGVQD